MTDHVSEILLINEKYISRQVQLIRDAAKNTLAYIQSQQDGLQFLFEAKFMQIGNNPQSERIKDNLIEQINQSLTLLTTYWILYQYEGKFYKANLGARNGTDLEIYKTQNAASPEDIFEVFAATDPYRNDKLQKDIKTITDRLNGVNRCVCFCSPICFRTSTKTYKGTPIDWDPKIPLKIKEAKKYGCTFKKKSVMVMWIKPETLLGWATKLVK